MEVNIYMNTSSTVENGCTICTREHCNCGKSEGRMALLTGEQSFDCWEICAREESL